MALEGKGRGRGGDVVKLSCFFVKLVKPKNLEKVKSFREKNTMEMNEVENTPLAKEEQGRTTLGSTLIEK